jgi:hypothetical protein
MRILKRVLKLAVWILEIAAGIFMVVYLLGIPHVWPRYRTSPGTAGRM